MAFHNCIGRKAQNGTLTEAQAKKILQAYGNTFRQFQNTMGGTQAQIAAAQRVVAQAQAVAAQRRRVAQLSATLTAENLQRMTDWKNIRGVEDPGDFLRSLVSNRRGAQGATIIGQYEAVRRAFRRDLTEMIKSFRANLLGMRNHKALLSDVVREVFGENTGNGGAKAIADSWSTVAERARTRFNAAGGQVQKLDGWGLPQVHSTDRVRRAGYDAWRDAILPRLDLQKMGDRFNNGLAYTQQTVEPLLKDAYEAIRTDGYSRRGPSAAPGRALYNRRTDHRFFTFRSADDWLAYSAEFGAGRDPFRVMTRHLDDMAMDIALMEVLGPNPSHNFTFLGDAARDMAARAQDPDAMKVAARKVLEAEAMFDEATGAANMPVNAGVARGASAVRQFLSSAQLGSATISSLTDFNTSRLAAGFVGMSQTGPIRKLLRLATSREMRSIANEAGLIFENAVEVGNAVARYELEELTMESAARMADFTIRASGLGWLTEVQRQAFGLEFMNTAARAWHKLDFPALDPRTQRMLKAYGISEADWAAIRRAPIHTARNGLELLRAQEIEAVAGARVADRYMEALTSQLEFAVPTTDVFGKAMVKFGTRAGTIPGEMVRFGMQYKAFPVTLLVTQFGRLMEEAMQGRWGSALGYFGGLFVANTVLGMVAMDLKDISKGREPRDKTDPRSWGAAALQGGALGIFGDFLFSDQNRFGGGLAETIAGPGVGFLNDLLRFSLGNAQQAIAGEDTGMGREFVNLLRRYTPGGSLWYLRLVYEREILDQLQILLDPDAHSSFRARERRAREMGTTFYAPPGERLIGGR